MRPGEIIVDSFAGGGGASLGIAMALGRGPDIAINHDREAIALHAANHPESLHLSEDVWKVDPREVCAGRPVGLMWLSPDCKHFSKAKGGKPVSKKIRGLAWVAIRWAAAVRPRVMVLENVEEFQKWGPLFPADHPVKKLRNRPDPSRSGLTFRRFVGRLRNLGYVVEWRELRASHHGVPTIRKRLFLIARCDGEPIVWPQETHGKARAQKPVGASDCIDWTIPTHSIFLTAEEGKKLGIKRPLAPNTLKRIARGIVKFVIENPRPFIVGVGGRAGQSPERSLDQPYQTITAKNDAAIIVPHITKFHSGSTGSAIQDPMPTVTSNSYEKRPGGAVPLGLVAPTLVQVGYGERDGQAPRTLDIEAPLGTVVSSGKHALVSAFMAQHNTGLVGHPMENPVSTIVGKACTQNVAVAHLLKLRGSSRQGQLFDEPAPTVTGGGTHLASVVALLIAYYGTDQQTGNLFDPSPTVTSKERLALVTVVVEGVSYIIADIGMRMLAPRELYRAQGFPDSYKIDVYYLQTHSAKGKKLPKPRWTWLSKTAQHRMCGNSVCPPLARAIVAENCGGRNEFREAA